MCIILTATKFDWSETEMWLPGGAGRLGDSAFLLHTKRGESFLTWRISESKTLAFESSFPHYSFEANFMRLFFAYYHNYCFCQFSLSRQNINGSSEKKLRYCNLSIVIHRELRTFFLVSLGHWIKRLGTFLLHVQEFPVY